MAIALFRAWKRSARRYLTTRRLLRLYRDVRELVDVLAERADCSQFNNFRTKVVRLRKAGYIGDRTSQRLNRLSTMARKAGIGELTDGELKDLVQGSTSLRRIMVSTERDTRRRIPVTQLAEQLGVSADWIEQNWLWREVDPLPSFQFCDRRFVNVDTFRDWRATQPIECDVEGGVLCNAG